MYVKNWLLIAHLKFFTSSSADVRYYDVTTAAGADD